MFSTNGHDIGGKDLSGKREDLTFIVRFNWKTSNHLKEAIQVLLAARLDAVCESNGMTSPRKKSEILDDQEFHRIRIMIASNPNTPPAVLNYLTRNAAESDVLERVAENPRSPVELLAVLAENEHARVRAAVAENLHTPEDVLAVLINDADPDVRYRLAENPNVGESLLEKLAADANPYVGHRASATLHRLQSGTIVSATFGNGVERSNGRASAR